MYTFKINICMAVVAHTFNQPLQATCEAVPHPHWNGDWLDFVRVLCRQSQLLLSHVCNVQKTVSQQLPPPQSLAIVIFPFPLLRCIWDLGRIKCEIDALFMTEHFTDTYSLYLDQSWICIKSHTQLKKFLWQGLRAALIHRYRDKVDLYDVHLAE